MNTENAVSVDFSKTPELGDLGRDILTSFEGVIIGITFFLTGCAQVGIRPRTLRDGKPVDVLWFDITRIEVLQKKAVEIKRDGPPMSIAVWTDRGAHVSQPAGDAGGPAESLPNASAHG